jgi:hypothetical protein
MRPMVATAIVLLGALTVAPAQQVLKAWEFDKDGDTEAWLPAHSLAPFAVEGGVLKTKVTDSDPYMHSSAGQSFDLQGNDFQYIEIRMKHTAGTGAEFFWANTIEGKDAGFVAGKERGFQCIPDNEWHVYRVYPMWQGQVTRLRLDPPEGEDGLVEIDYIRIIQGPISTHDPQSPVWDFTKGNGGWVAQTGGTLLLETPNGAQTELTAESVVLVGPPIELKASDYAYAYLQLETSGPLTGNLYWSGTDNASFPGCNALAFEVPAGAFAENLSLAANPMYGGDLRRLQLSLKGDPGTQVTLQQLALSPKPLGPARLKLVSFAAADVVAPLDRDGKLLARLQNLGGEEALDTQLTVTVAEGPVRLTDPATQTLKPVAPGGSAEVTWTFRPSGEGRAKVRLNGPNGLTAETEVIASKSFPTPEATAQSSAQVTAGAAWIGNDKVRLTLAKVGDRFIFGRLDAIESGKPRPMAVLPHLGQLAVAGAEGFANLTAERASGRAGNGKATLSLVGHVTVGKVSVNAAWIFHLEDGDPYISAVYALTARGDLQITAFRGPWLWAGEGSFGDQQDLALFPGSEYMVKGERSSSTLDIAPPRNVRFAPHPNTVTIPSMAIEQDGAIVGLMWDPLQKWDGEHQKPTAVFASPNFVEGHANHLLGLCLPSIPEWAKPNELLAEKPYDLKAGKTLNLVACLYAEAPSNVLRSVDLYFDRYGLPSLPPKPRSYDDTIAMSLRAYEDILWVEKAKGWMGVIGWAPGASQGVALDYVVASRRLKDRAWAQQLAEKGLALGSPADLPFALHHFGTPSQALVVDFGNGRAQGRRAPEDGKYTFQPTTDQLRTLGAEGSTAVGICARGVRPLLDLALLTGDPEPLEAALKTLGFMERFQVPRASQVWEVPVHTPDILAAGDACDVYLTAYKLTGDRHWLERAAYWAKTGLPFVYMWQAPEQRPLMKGASIPVFGASFYTGSWFARPVQWNGLSYARSLLELAKYDDSLPWRHFAEMITISGMNMQSTREKDCGCYTDNWSVIDDVECVGCMLAPGGILDNVLELMGAPAGMRTEVVHDGGKPICINAAPIIADAALTGGTLSFGLRYDHDNAAYAAVMPLAEPAGVEVDGTALPRLDGPTANEGWSYREGVGCLTLKLQFGQDVRKVRILGARAILPGMPVPDWEFNTSGDTEGWQAAHDVAPLTVENGNLVVEVTGGDPYIYGPGMIADAAHYSGIAFRATATAPGGEVFFATDSGGLSPQRERAFALPADGQFHEVTIDLADHPEWKGTITQLRLDFAGPPCRVEIDWVKLLKR